MTFFLDCPDIHLIPYKLYVGHGGRWTECKVELHGRPPLQGANPHIPPGSDNPLHVLLQAPQLPPHLPLQRWRQRQIHGWHPFRESAKSLASAAGFQPPLLARCTSPMYTPRPGKQRNIQQYNTVQGRRVPLPSSNIWTRILYGTASRSTNTWNTPDLYTKNRPSQTAVTPQAHKISPCRKHLQEDFGLALKPVSSL